MERSNYNRGGYDGGNRGGRNNAGRSSYGGRGGGRGNGGGSYPSGGRGGSYPNPGRNSNNQQQYGNQQQGQYQELHGSGGGYYPNAGRGGSYSNPGRNSNYQQQYGNQPQQHYQELHGSGGGRGRGRESGGIGGGRGQQFNRNPRQTADRVPDRSHGDREVRSWSRVASAQTETHNRTDVQIQEVPHLETGGASSLTERSDDVKTVYAPIERPKPGNAASRRVRLLVNHFPVGYAPSNAILHYDVDVKRVAEQEASSSSTARVLKKPIPKSALRQIQENLCSENPNQFPLLQIAYDGEKNIFSAISLPPGTYNVELFGRSYSCTINYVAELNLSSLQAFLNRNSTQVPRDVLQALDVVTKAVLFREKVPVGRGFYPRLHRREDDLRCGVAAHRGSHQSLKVTSNGLVMCKDYSVVPFRKRIPVLDFLKEHLGILPVDIYRFKDDVLSALRGLKVTVTHRRTNQKYTVSGLSEELTENISFKQEDPEGKKEPEKVMLTDYFRDKWGKEIVHKGIPCLHLGNGKRANHVPIEFCVLAEDKRFPKEKLGKEAARMLKDMSLLPPDYRMTEICSMVREEYAPGSHGAGVILNFGMEVGMAMTEVDARVLEPPKLKLGGSNGRPNIVVVDRQKCHYNFMQGRTLIDGKAVVSWALIDFSSKDRNYRNRLDAGFFIPKLMSRCRTIGVEMGEPVEVLPAGMHELSDANRVFDFLSWFLERAGTRLQLIVCVMPEQHNGYKYLKWAETKVGVITQCVLSQNANKANDQFLANLGLKINAKLGGSNMELVESFPLFSPKDRFMFIGADVNHPAASNTSSPSVAAVVGSVNWPAATRYAARISPQAHRKEEIVNFGSLCLGLVKSYEQVNGAKPDKIVVFRDGVSDDQFEMVLNREMVDLMRTICTGGYRPLVTYVVAQKRHTTRLFLKDGKNIVNMNPGTVVDTEIVHPTIFDFYLCSHFGGIGTSKATRYSVIWDENKFSSDEIQRLAYNLCYIFARCTKPVSLVTPVYYADLVAYRGRLFNDVAVELDPSASFDQYFYNHDQDLKDTMFFI